MSSNHPKLLWDYGNGKKWHTCVKFSLLLCFHTSDRYVRVVIAQCVLCWFFNRFALLLVWNSESVWASNHFGWMFLWSNATKDCACAFVLEVSLLSLSDNEATGGWEQWHTNRERSVCVCAENEKSRDILQDILCSCVIILVPEHFTVLFSNCLFNWLNLFCFIQKENRDHVMSLFLCVCLSVPF